MMALYVDGVLLTLILAGWEVQCTFFGVKVRRTPQTTWELILSDLEGKST